MKKTNHTLTRIFISYWAIDNLNPKGVERRETCPDSIRGFFCIEFSVSPSGSVTKRVYKANSYCALENISSISLFRLMIGRL
jgi:hypothetical protein